jgi:hypothetical protein
MYCARGGARRCPVKKLALNINCDWLESYRAANAELLKHEPDFAHWLQTEYIPIAGGWQY